MIDMLIGFACGASVAAGGYFLGTRTYCRHVWGRWEKWALIYQRRECKVCGRQKIRH